MIFHIFFYAIFVLFIQQVNASIDNFLAQFKRPITFLEISDSQSLYTFSYASRYKGVYVLLCQAEKIDHIKRKVQDFCNIVLLHPKEFSTQSLSQLASCEHFDITIVHDWSLLKINPYILSILLMLGDYLVLDVPSDFKDHFLSDEQKNCLLYTEPLAHGKERIYFKNLKTSLQKARWYMTNAAQLRQPSYTIFSTYDEKKLIKGSHKKESPWIPGINLVTAVMLNLVYPTNEILRNNIKKFKEINHNDPVIGNMIVQGKHLKLIDFEDSRRNADQEKCLKSALKLFTWIHRPKDPEDMMRKYAGYVHG